MYELKLRSGSGTWQTLDMPGVEISVLDGDETTGGAARYHPNCPWGDDALAFAKVVCFGMPKPTSGEIRASTAWPQLSYRLFEIIPQIVPSPPTNPITAAAA